jgi:hypothetical protein
MHSTIELSKIEEVLDQVRFALRSHRPQEAREALLASLQVLQSLVESTVPDRSSQHAGSIEYTFEDEGYEPYGRAVDVRVYYRWNDYNTADDPRPVWGAVVEDLDVLAVRYFDESGNEIPAAEHASDLAWQLLDKSYQQVTEACTEDGYRRGAGAAPLTYAPGNTSAKGQTSAPDASSPSADFASRMARSVSTRIGRRNRKQLG